MQHYCKSTQFASHPIEIWISEIAVPDTELHEPKPIKIAMTCQENKLQSPGRRHKNTQLKIEMRVQAKYPYPNCKRIWENISTKSLLQEVRSICYMVVYATVPTKERLNIIHLQPSDQCSSLKQEDTTQTHRMRRSRSNLDLDKYKPCSIPKHWWKGWSANG
jgi:hypothetical protein